MTKDEALKLAMDWYGSGNQDPDEFEKLILSIVAQPEQEEIEQVMLEVWQDVGDPRFPHIAQPDQEPVAWGMMNDDGKIYDCICPEEHDRFEGEYTVPLYTTPPHRKPLTDKEIGEIVGETLDPWSCARAIEAAHGIKGEA